MSSLALASWLSQLAHPVVGRPRHWMGHALPECLAVAALLLRTITPLEALILPTVVRLAWLLAEVSHGSAHTLVRALVDGDASLIRLDNLLEHRRPGALMAALRPFALLPLFPHTRDGLARLPSGDPTSWKVRLKAAAPLMLHLTVSLAAATALLEQPEAGTPGAHGWAADGLVAMLLANLWLLLLSRSDWQMLASGKGRWLYCGNFGLLAATDHPQRGDLLSGQTIRMAQRMGRETELRGAQAGGGLVMAMDRRGQAAFVGEKIVNAKRGDLTPALESAFRQSRRRARRHGVRRHPAGLVACWHYRFGTSGPPAVRETHWQEWSPARRARIWSRQPNGQWHWQWQTVHHRITHNGDFETLEAFGTRVAVTGDLGSWLERVLEQPAPAVVDSARIAGMMDLLICQGDWWAAVRWGALSTLISYPASIPGSALERWASWFEKAFEVWSQEGGGRPGADGENQQLTPALVALLLPSLRSDPLLAHRSDGDLEAWIAACVGNFLQNDPARATRQFMDHARGSFGLVVISTTWPDRLVLCSLGQPLTVGVHPREGMALYASEPAAVDAVLLDQPGSWRCDLDDNAGEIAVLSHSSLQIYSLSLERSLSDQEQNARQVSYRGTDAAGRWPSAPRDRRADHDPVGADIASIPSLLAAIHDDWSNPGSANRRSAEALAQLLIAKAANLAEKEKLLRSAGLDESLSRSSHVDLLITGVENSLWLGEQFGRDLNSLMPRLTVRTLSANEVLKALQNDVESLDLARQTIVLVLSHTSRTFPSRQVMEACDLLVRRRVIREFFVMTGEPENLLGSPMLQGQRSPRAGRPETSSLHRLFTTGAGRRRSEAATATVVAMEQTLTQLLFSLSRQVLQAFPATQPLGMRLSRTTLARLETTENEALLQDSQIIVGTNQQGAPRPSTTSRSLATMGRQWSQHVLESPLVWLLHAAYITVSLELGLPLVETLARQLVGESLWDGAGTWSALLRAVALAGDVLFYIFGPWIWTVLLRWLQGRPLLARLGRRTLVVSETTWLHPLLTNYISKLFALSFGITSLDIQGADGGDHLLHTHAHRVVRGTLLFFGVPDGRSGGRQQAEANAFLLTARQADGIRNWNTGPELAAVGSDPALGLGPFRQAVVLPCATEHQGEGLSTLAQEDALVEQLRESRFGSVRRLLAAYVMFWAMARAVGMLPLLRFKWWRSQSRTRVMTTAAPVSAARLDLAEPREVLVLSLEQLANREQS